MDKLIPIIALIVGLAMGAGLVWVVLKGKISQAIDKAKAEAEMEKAMLAERLSAKEQQLTSFNSSLEQAHAEVKRLNDDLRTETARLSEQWRTESTARSSEAQKAVEGAKRVVELEASVIAREEFSQNLQSEISNLKAQISERDTRLEEERKSAQGKLELLTNAKKELSEQFQNLANTILDEKTKKFTEINKTNIDALLSPLGVKIREFQTKIENTHVEDTKQRTSLLTQLDNLKLLNAQIGQDAINLTNALKGKTKTQGNWGEQILETILQNAGLIKGQHYDVQVSINTDEGRRVQPDVILHLPEERHIVIDSKVNLTAYTRYCEIEDGAERESELKKHVLAFRNHVAELSGKEYQDHYKLTSLEFVLMFIPLEPAFMLALQTDESIYDYAYQKRISIVTPSTLHAAVHTVSNIWRQDNQNKNAMKIADEAGKLFDKFVAFTNDLEDIGLKLTATQKSFDSAHNKLISGKGNLIGRAENIRLLGAKAGKKLALRLVDSSGLEGLSEESDIVDHQEVEAADS